MTTSKKILPYNVLEAAKQRISATFDNFSKIYVSFSGGKDSTVMLHLGMDADEVLRLTQITGIAEMFKDAEFSAAWEPEISEDEPDTM